MKELKTITLEDLEDLSDRLPVPEYHREFLISNGIDFRALEWVEPKTKNTILRWVVSCEVMI